MQNNEMEGWYIRNNYLFDRSNLNFVKKWWLDIDKVNYLLINFIIIFGLFVVVSSSPYVAKRIGVDYSFFIQKQIMFVFISLIILNFFSSLNRDYIKIIAILGLLTCIFLLVLVLATGFEIKGAKRWIFLFGFTLQPSELAKIFFLVFNAFLLNKAKNEKWFIKYGLSCAVYLTLAALFVLQPDFGMTFLLTMTWLVQLFAYGLPLIFIFIVLGLFILGMIYAYHSIPHVAGRINKFLDNSIENYQVDRSTDAYLNGGFFGTGIGNGFVKKFIPDGHTDFIFAVISEEFGLIFAIALMLVFLMIITRVMKRMLVENDLFIYLATMGLISLFTLQTLVNIGVSIGMLPTKGMTLPFISYGGSSMFAMSICFGIILAFTRKKYDNEIEQKNIVLSK